MKAISQPFVFLLLVSWSVSVTLAVKVLPKIIKDQPSQKLSLTPFLKSGQISEAREAFRVKNFTKFDILSYSGYITVNEECNSNIFFWFFPAAFNRETAPLILWHGGGPGGSGMLGLFVEHGPYKIDERGHVHLRAEAWTMSRSVIYIDSPVGTGFSNADREECFVKSAYETAQHIYEVLNQFFQVFPEYSLNDFYVFSASYGGKYAPEIAHEIHVQNQKAYRTDGRVINLKGLSINSGFSDPISQIDYGDFFYNMGIIDKVDRDYFRKQEALAKEHIKNDQWNEAFDIIEPLIIGNDGESSYLANVTGIKWLYNLAKTWESKPPFMKHHVHFLNRPEIQKAIHTDLSKNFSNSNTKVYLRFKEDIYQSVKPLVEELLNHGYKVFIGSSQMDLIVPPTTVAKFVEGLEWRYSKEFQESKTKPWISENKDVGGYYKSVENLSYIFIRDAGHMWAADQPEWSLQIMMQFTQPNNSSPKEKAKDEVIAEKDSANLIHL